MNVSLTDELKDFVQKKIASGAFPSEEALLQEAVRRLRQQDRAVYRSDSAETSMQDDLIDHEAIEYCARELEGKDVPSIEEVRRSLLKIPGSMAQAVIEERDDRI